MSRLGDLIKLERSRHGLNAKAVAKKCGVSESFILEVESGTRIINDGQARRILKSMGMQQQTEADFTLDDIASTVDLEQAQQQIERAKQTVKRKQESEDAAPAEAGVSGSIWLDALSNVLKRVPVYNAVMKETGRRLVPVENGRIEGAAADKVFYYTAPDNDLRGFRIQRGDLLLVVPASAPVDGAIMLLETPQGRVLRKVHRLEDFRAMLQRYDAECETEIKNVNELAVVGRCVRLEAEL